MLVARTLLNRRREPSLATSKEGIMRWDGIESHWDRFAEKAKVRWRKLPDEEVQRVNGNQEQLVDLVQDAYGLDRGEAEQQIKDWRSWL